MWVRATTCYRKVDGAWKIVHEHQSVPFDPHTGAASLDLAP
jgi:ketosteroid isomerase-like protein